MNSFGASGAAIGRSAAGRRIEAAGREYQAKAGAVEPPPARPAPAVPRAAAPAAMPPAIPLGACQRIIAEVSEKHDIPVKDILSERRAWALIPARHEAIYRCVAETALSLPAIGRVFNRDHTSIGHAVMRHHVRTGAPLPRGMVWMTGWKVRHPKTGKKDAAKAAPRSLPRSAAGRLATLEAARKALDAEIARLRTLAAAAADRSEGEGAAAVRAGA
ncbi:MAG: helix-turn-helix domain-containing protein [Parvibaculaceae bacterium]